MADEPATTGSEIQLLFIVHGEDVPVIVLSSQSAAEARDLALMQSRSTGRPFDDWEIRDERGHVVAPGESLAAFETHDRLFLTLSVGYGGTRPAVTGRR